MEIGLKLPPYINQGGPAWLQTTGLLIQRGTAPPQEMVARSLRMLALLASGWCGVCGEVLLGEGRVAGRKQEVELLLAESLAIISRIWKPLRKRPLLICDPFPSLMTAWESVRHFLCDLFSR